MPRSLVIRVTGLLALVLLCTSFFWLGPLTSLVAHSSRNNASAAHAASPRLTYHQYADGPYKVVGNQVIGADNQPYIFHGVGRDGYEFSCVGGGYTDSAHLAFMGSGTTSANGTYWFSNTVRLPLSQSIWLNGNAGQNCSAAQYQANVKATVDALTALKLNVILDLQWSDADGQAPGAGWEMPDARSVTFWQQVAPIYSTYSNVIYELYNEPHPSGQSSTAATWQCWLSGCQITGDNSTGGTAYNYAAVGMQTLVNTVRAHANNLALVAGINWGYDLSQYPTYKVTGSNIVLDTHPYPYGGKNTPALWDADFGFLTPTYAVMSAESGEYDCGSSFMSTVISYFDAHSMGWIAWAWYDVGGTNQGCGYPQLIKDYQGTPLASMGTYIYQHMLSYVNSTPPPPPPVGPVNTTWYFAEGRVGGYFKEFLSLENPTTNSCDVTITYLAQPDNGPTYTKTASVTVPADTRVEENVNTDLGESNTGVGPGISDSAIVTVNTSASPNCTGIVAERPMYFNALGTNSGSDVIGMTHLGTTFYFGDLGVGNGYTSFIAILNPPSSPTATVTARYYSGGSLVATQSVTVPGGVRGTINPGAALPKLPAHVAVVVTSTQAVAVERPTYFSNINGGNAGTVSGAADVIGVQTLSNDWLFAEGYTGGKFQENYVLANLDPANTSASVTIKLEFQNGGPVQTHTLTIGPNSQATFNVNASAPNQSVSAEITSTGAKIVAEREMFFQYSHQANGRNLNSVGGTDVLGQNGPASSTVYSFAEGYTNVGYDVWLTLQNPTGSDETLTIGLVNGRGNSYVFTMLVKANTRATVDVTGAVIQHLYHNGDGYQGYEVAMVVQSASGAFVAERPMYWNTAGTQGGSDVIGYVGG
jgi:endoglucanase